MSLLLEALKKAEKAKEDAQRRALGASPEPAAASPAPELRPPELEPAVRTRDELPELRRPSEAAGAEAPPPPPPER